ncbi:membrane-bound PQQ-dependent dehydrogenase, glucose/quinate/shikimate family [Haliea sp. E1-2-M8]|uniref:membrane-bound PQQ-dependent dehydrogenase, glucose/quinate/shikimate family n=1 Tax=Haliea sp. E1-2-M8 TaxID=3064706 RepID=UPI002728FA24|nr:membrane-bound PQQ-dependent dehydrogenase, glucose/quinate/shikimate family [Haliea sp. E1-2-M8]MDO8863424.1 membrane-bound PQQ-dependent dehydrogenase, glucose/quinate/shikimate family [Haliea sp. E1-2-M8]
MALILLVFAIPMIAGGMWLIVIAGSWYYFLAGTLLLGSAVNLLRRSLWAIWLYLGCYLFTLIWAFWEVGLSLWPLMPRLLPFTVLLIPMLVCFRFLRDRGDDTATRAPLFVVPVALALAAVVVVADLVLPQYPLNSPNIPVQRDMRERTPPASSSTRAAPSENAIVSTGRSAVEVALQTGADWPAYGGTYHAMRYSPLEQIIRENVGELTRVWHYRTGDMPREGDGSGGKYAAETTPLVVDGNMYLCTPMTQLLSLDAVTGEERWRYDPVVSKESIPYSATCRGVAWYRTPDAAMQPGQEQPGRDDCGERIIAGTLDGRLIAVSAASGLPCTGFGDRGQVNLLDGIGESVPGFLSVTSPPTIVRGVVVIGHQVLDNQRRDAPSGVVRGYDAVTGELVWAWDMLQPELTGAPPPGETYSRGTPNMWTIASGDEELGLMYLPMGNAANDYYGTDRTETENQYSTALVALDVTSGKVVWRFQTVYYDIWDYDLGSQATLVDYPVAGRSVPALVLSSKQGDIYVIDRATGEHLVPIEKRPVPQGGVEAENLSPVQPFSTYHSLAMPDLRERDMWGMTPLDQLWCRIQYRRSSYAGIYTPPTEDRRWIQFPGYNGGSDWGGVTVDPQRGILVANYNNMPNHNRLMPREEIDATGTTPIDVPGKASAGSSPDDLAPQAGSPFGVAINAGWRVRFTGLLCTQPPYGGIRAIDLATGKTLWDRPLGEARRNGPFGISSHLPVLIGTPNNGGSIAIASGLVFIAAATDDLLIAIDIETGETVWREKLPAGGQATPITYEVDGHQYLTMMAGGHHFMETPVGDHVITWALPTPR